VAQDRVLPVEDNAGPATTFRLEILVPGKLKVHWTAASGLEGDEEKERLRAVLPPGATVAEERAKVGWACKSWLNGHNRPMRSMRLLKRLMIFIKLGGAMEAGRAPEG
jgi:hypothetical protein